MTMAPKKSRTLSDKTKNIVWAKSAGRCQFHNCNKSLIGDLIAASRKLNKGYVAHVIADSEKGPRGDEKLSTKLANDPDNVLLLCDPHHREIDRENPERYPPEVLYEMKHKHEEWVSTVLSSGPDSRSHILQFSSTIGQNETAIPLDECTYAMLPQKTPASDRAIEIKIRGLGLADNDEAYWSTEVKRLRQSFMEQIRGRIESGEIRHLSVFGFGPIPLLMELGRLLSDISDVNVHQKHREPKQTWRWANDSDTVKFQSLAGKIGKSDVALKLSISARVSDDRVIAAVGADTSIWEIKCKNPHNDIIRSGHDLSAFRNVVRQALEGIRQEHGADVIVNVFPGIPVSCAIEFGRVWQPKVHLPMQIFDQNADRGFVLRHTIMP